LVKEDLGNVINVLDYGAVADGVNDDSKAINDAIEACAEEGGGTVYFGPGRYLTGPINLKSNVTLYLEEEATILFSRNFDDYPLVETRREGIHLFQCSPLIFGKNLRNVALRGKGVFDGQGDAWRPVVKAEVSEEEWRKLVESGGVVDEDEEMWWPTSRAFEGKILMEKCKEEGRKPSREECERVREFFRPQLLQLYNCEDVILDGPTFKNSPQWAVHIVYSRNVTVKNIRCLNPWNAANGDGLDIDSSRNVYVTGCYFDVGDDCVCLKSGRDEEGRKIGKPTENVTVENCIMRHGHGGIVIGSETSGGVRNLTVDNCIFDGTERGIRFKTKRGRGGVVENITISNIIMRNIMRQAIVFNMFYGERTTQMDIPPEPVSEETPIFRNIRISNVTCEGASSAIEILGLPEMPLKRVTLENIRISAERGVTLQNCGGIRLIRVEVEAKRGPSLECYGVEDLELTDFRGKIRR